MILRVRALLPAALAAALGLASVGLVYGTTDARVGRDAQPVVAVVAMAAPDPAAALRVGSGTLASNEGSPLSAVALPVCNESGTISVNTTWDASCVHIFTSTVTVNAGATLTVLAGTVIKLTGDLRISGAGSALQVNGTSLLPVYFTSTKDDSAGGDTNNDGIGSAPAPGDWAKLQLIGGAALAMNYAQVRYGGGGLGATIFNGSTDGVAGTINIDSSTIEKSYVTGISINATSTSFTLANSIVQDNAGDGLRLVTGVTNISNSIIRNNAGDGIRLGTNTSDAANTYLNLSNSTISGNSAASRGYGVRAALSALPTLVNDTITNNSNRAVELYYASGGTFDPQITATGNASNAIHLNPWGVGGVLVPPGQTLTLKSQSVNVPYRLHGTVNGVLALSAGSVVKLTGAGNAGGVTVDGAGAALQVNGTNALPVYFTSTKDDSIGGDTNNDGIGTTPVPGNWGNILLRNGAALTMNYGHVRYGGSGPSANIFNNSGAGDGVAGPINISNSIIEQSYEAGINIGAAASFSLTNSAVLTSDTDGLRLGNPSTPHTITNNSFVGNVNHGVSGGTSAVHLHAPNNWWGSSSGPASDGNSCNTATGTGDKVSCYVDFAPSTGSSGGAGPPRPPASKPPVVVLVHGWNAVWEAPACGLGPLQGWLDVAANMGSHEFTTDCQWYSTRAGVVAGANELSRKVRGWAAAGVPKVDVVVHSEGGLVARYCVQFLECATHVRSLTMIGTPNLGTPMAVTPCNLGGFLGRINLSWYDQGACDMVPGNSFLKKLNATPSPPVGVSYRVLMGNRSNNPLLMGTDNDCVVPVNSAFGLRRPPETDLGFAHDPLFYASHATIGVISFWGGCQGVGEPDFLPIRERVRDLLLASNGFAPVAPSVASVNGTADTGASTPADALLAPPASSSASTLASQFGLIATGQTIDVPIVMPASQTTGSFVFSHPTDPSVVLTFSLMRPGTVVVGPGDADVAYESGAGFGGLVEARYTITNPAAGTWAMRVTGATVPVTGWPYSVQALVSGVISVTAGAGAGHYDVGQAFDLSADVAISDVPFAGATVHATITKPDQSTTDVAMTDAGGGAYTGSFSDTAACGLYQVTITAEGSDNGTAFSRQDRTIAIAGAPGNVILDPCNADSDADGFTDRVEIDAMGTNPGSSDSDGDGYGDAAEVAILKNPNTYCNIMRADLDNDGAVSILDLTLVAAYFTQSIPPAPERYNQDADTAISILDLTRMANVFTQPVSTCP